MKCVIQCSSAKILGKAIHTLARFGDEAFVETSDEAKSRMMMKTIQNFPATVEEITLIITNEKVVMKNYVDDEPDPNQIIHTELTLEKEEFEQYELEEEAIITFCLKELRAIISFAESCNVPIVINFQAPGKPILFELQEIPGLEAEFLLATLAEESQTNTSLQQSNNTSTVMQTNSNANLGIERLVELSVADTNTGTSVGMKDQNPSTSTAVTENVPSECSNENEDEEIPSTPPSKKFRRMFLGLSSPSRSPQYTTVIPDPDEILAEASDED